MSGEITSGLTPPGANGGSPGFLMDLPERAFVVALRNGFEQFAADPSYWDAILRTTPAIERDSIKAAFAPGGKYHGFQIRTGFPTLDYDKPEVTVMVESETQGVDIMGYELAAETAGYFDGDGGKPRASYRVQTLTIVSTSQHPDVALYLYRACDAILQASIDWLMTPAPDGAGLTAPEWQSGEPIIVDPRNPNRLWARQSKWTAMGLVGAPFRIPPPARGVLVHFDGVTVRGIGGRVGVD